MTQPENLSRCVVYLYCENSCVLAVYRENHVLNMVSVPQALEEMGFLHAFSHHCESTVKTFGPLQTYYPPPL